RRPHRAVDARRGSDGRRTLVSSVDLSRRDARARGRRADEVSVWLVRLEILTYLFAWYFTHVVCVTRCSSAANEIAAFVAKRGELFDGNVASVASPTKKTLKSFARF